MSSNAMILIDPDRALTEAIARRQIVDRLRTQNILRSGVDFGVIPGSSKPTLLKPGAERLCSAFGLNPKFELINSVERWDADSPLFHYQYCCHLIHIETGQEFATGIGSCNSMESKYRWRKAQRVCPNCGQPAIIKGKAEYGGGWLCFKKNGGCGAKFPDGDPAIEAQAVGNVPNDDVFSLVNTIDKMAQKRALISAVLIGANASEHFTQDIEDLPGYSEIVIDAEYTVVDAHTGEIKQPPAAPSAPAAPLPFAQDRDRITKFVARMTDAYGVTTAEIMTALGVTRFGEYSGEEADAEAAVKALVKPPEPPEPTPAPAKANGKPRKDAEAAAPGWTPELEQGWRNFLKWADETFGYDGDAVLLALNDVMPPVNTKKDWRGTSTQAKGAIIAAANGWDAERVGTWCDKANANDELRGRANDMIAARALLLTPEVR
jgi:hypothetical protein